MSGQPIEIVLASAGTGKTYRLTNRYLAILLNARDRAEAARIAPRILATTFTRKAAGEIRDRVLSRLAAAATRDVEADALGSALGVQCTSRHCAEVLRGVCDAISDLRVMTIDSLLVGMVLRCSGECGMHEGWRLGDVEEDDLLRTEAVDAVLSGGDREDLLTFLHILHQSGYGRTVHQEVANAVSDAYGAYMAVRFSPEVWERIEPADASYTEEAIEDLCVRLSRLVPPLTKGGTPVKAWLGAFDSARRLLDSRDWSGLLEKGLGDKVVSGETTFSSHEISGPTLGVFMDIVAAAKSAIRTQCLRRNIAVRELLEGFHQAYVHAKRNSGVYTFDDMPRLLAEADARGGLLDMRYRIDGAVDHVLLDEFQDTSVLQFDLLRPMLEEMIGSGGGRSVFVVGDIKQSLYGWRGAERDLMPALKRSLWPDAAEHTMSDSYRSGPVVMDAVNRVFGSLADLPSLYGLEAAEEWGGSYVFHRSAGALVSQGGAVRLIEARPDEQEDQGDSIVRIVAERVADAKRLCPGCSVGVLVRRTKQIPAIVTAVRSAGYDAVEEGGNPLTDSPAVCALLSVLQLADHPGDSMAFFHVGTSVFGRVIGITGTRDDPSHSLKAQEIRGCLIDEGYEHYLRRLVQSCEADLNVRDRARCDQLFELAGEFDSRAGTRPGLFVELAEKRRVDEPSRGTIRVMTVHGAKGLEFDCVVLADLDSRWQIKPGGVLTYRPAVLSPIESASLYPNEAARLSSDKLSELYDNANRKVCIEDLCVLYVAMTRAVHVLDMVVGPERFKGPSAANTLRDALAVGDSTGSAPGVLYEQIRGEWWEDCSALDPSGISCATEECDWRISSTHDEAGSRRAPSTHDTGDRIGTIFDLERDRAMSRGTLIHRWMERIAWADDPLPSDSELLDDAKSLGWVEKDAVGVVQIWRGWLENPQIRDALSRPGEKESGDIILRIEWAYALQRDDYVTSGVIDRLVVGMLNGRSAWAEIIDYKTDTGDPAELSKLYASQIQAYIRSVAQILDLSPVRISGRLVFLACGRVIDIPA